MCIFVLQKRNVKTNIRLILFPFVVCVILVVIQAVINSELDKPKNKCGCICTRRDGNNKCLEERCGIQYSDTDQVATCAITSPPKWPPLLQVPSPEYRAVQNNIIPFSDLPNDSCRRTGSCPVTFLFTGKNQSFGESMYICVYIFIYILMFARFCLLTQLNHGFHHVRCLNHMFLSFYSLVWKYVWK